MTCGGCGVSYRQFRTGFTFRDIYDMIYTRKWKRRNGVLGAWYELKQSMWKAHREECEKERAE